MSLPPSLWQIDDSEMAVQVLNDITGQTDDITAVEVVLTSKLLGTYTAEVKQAENVSSLSL